LAAVAAAGITLTGTDNLAKTTAAISEDASTDTVKVVLAFPPSANVIIATTSGNTAEATTDVESLTFTTANWSTAQTLTITGVDDASVDGDATTDITFNPSASSEPLFAALSATTIVVTNTDNDVRPIVASISPVDTSTDVSVSTTISAAFSKAMTESTITTNTTNATCSGTFQVSNDNFSTCVQMSAAPAADTDKKVFTITPASSLNYNAAYKIKITTGVSDDGANAMAAEFLTATGFTTSTPQTYTITGKIPDTGQTTCYNASENITCPNSGQDFNGQDANFTINAPSYTNLGNNAVLDNITGLVWEQKTTATEDVTYDWASAETYCENLSSNYGGYTDWRLPSPRELLQTSTYEDNASTIYTTYFTNTNSISKFWANYWTSAKYTSSVLPYGFTDTNATYGWYVRYGDGDAWLQDVTVNTLSVRCVRGNSITDSYTDHGNLTVTDNNTGFIWGSVESATMTWQEALVFCENSSHGGTSDWRLPNVKELQSIVDYAKSSAPYINTTYFGSAYSSNYWSSTTKNAAFKYIVSFYSGQVHNSNGNISDSYNVRCVRGGQ
jgi:hypothetical protein